MEKTTLSSSSPSKNAAYPFPKKNPSRVLIDRFSPAVDGGKFPAKRFLNDDVKIMAVLLVDGHELPQGRALVRHESESEDQVLILAAAGNDEWVTHFQAEKLGRYRIRIEAAMDRFGTWRVDTLKKLAAGQDIALELRMGLELLEPWSEHLTNSAEKSLFAKTLKLLLQPGLQKSISVNELSAWLKDPALEAIASRIYDASSLTTSTEFTIQVEPAIARFSSWYEFFPRSLVGTNSAGELKHGTLRQAADRLAYVKDLGFNVVYFPPIHPVGHAYRKGKNNTLTPTESDVGSPWAIGSNEGGHKSILPALGNFEDFAYLVQKAKALDLEIALDIAFQCSPDHPYVKEHPDWFKKRPDGSIQYAENPPKKYQDIYPFDFESADWENLWLELRDVVLFWIKKGVRIFRVDNPHTKSFHFWEWLIGSVREKNPEVIFLAEAFTRPKVMNYLAKSGFSQSYTYFTWRNVKWEITQYMNELTKTELVDFYGPNFWPNTPDILPKSLQTPDATMYMQRLVLAATLSSNYGIYGPAYELMESAPFKAGGEEYLHSEKYELKRWNLEDPQSLAPFIKKVNGLRQQEKALQQNRDFQFHNVNNESLIAYSKSNDEECILVVVNLDSKNVQSGMVDVPLTEWGLTEGTPFEVRDLLNDGVYFWSAWKNFVELRPGQPAHIFKIIKSPTKENQ